MKRTFERKIRLSLMWAREFSAAYYSEPPEKYRPHIERALREALVGLAHAATEALR